MELKGGYQHTQAGLIPNDWTALKLPEVAWFQEGPGVRTHQFRSSGIKLLNGTNISNGRLLLDSTNRFVSREEAFGAYRHFLVDVGDLLLATSGITIEKLHEKVAFATEEALPLCMNTSTVRFKASRAVLSDTLLYFFLQSDIFKTQIGKQATGSAQLNFGPSHLRNVVLPVPPGDSEQTAIATALSDVDALLNALDRLIAKKRDLKQAVMQQLLTGRTRLPGFSSKWEKRLLGSLGVWRGGITPSMQNPQYWDGGDFPWIASGDVKSARLTDTNLHVTSTAVRNGVAVVVPAGTVVVVARSGILRRYLPVALLEKPMAINQDIKALMPSREVNGEFLLHAINGCGEQILASCLKAGTTVESIEFPWLKAFTILLPSHSEQIAIASVLSDMDAELVALEKRRDKIRLLKQGMMQELLTGRTRLV